MLDIPAITSNADDITYRVEGRGDNLKEIRKVGAAGAEVPVWTFPLTLTLIMNPDMVHDPPCITTHTLRIEDSLCMDYKLTIASALSKEAGAKTIAVEWPLSQKDCMEALVYMYGHTEGRGLKWVAKQHERGRAEDWCGEVKMADASKELSHYWPDRCSDTPPGKLIRILGVLDMDLEIPDDGRLELGSHVREESMWYQLALEQGLVGGSPRPTGEAVAIA